MGGDLTSGAGTSAGKHRPQLWSKHVALVTVCGWFPGNAKAPSEGGWLNTIQRNYGLTGVFFGTALAKAKQSSTWTVMFFVNEDSVLISFLQLEKTQKKNKISSLQTIVDSDPITSVPDTTLRLCCHGKPLNIFHHLKISSTVTSCLIITFPQVAKLIYNIGIMKMLLYFSMKINKIAQYLNANSSLLLV